VDGLVLSGAGPATGLTLLLPKAAFERVGFFDERLNGALAVADYGLRARQLGLRVAVTGKPRYGSANETDFSALRKKWMGNKLFDVEFGPRPPIETIVLRQRAKGPWSRRLNAALKRSPAEHFLVVSEGVRPTRRLVDGLLKAARLESNIGVVGPRSRGTRLAWQDAPRKGPLRGGAYIRSFCFLIPRRMFEAIGPFDERFRGPLALADFCLRSHQRGFQVVVAGDVYLRSPRAGVDPHRVRDFPLFFEKWSGNRIFETELVA
jgi:hypothetical protein